MAEVNGNEHFENAEEILSNLDQPKPEGAAALWLAEAQVEATLALAHEQRTANLLAANQQGLLHPPGFREFRVENMLIGAEIRKEILQRLGRAEEGK